MFSANATQVDDKIYVDDVFSTHLYTGNGSVQTINNGIDLAGKGGLVWSKSRTTGNEHNLWDTERGDLKELSTNTTNAQLDGASYGNNGITFGTTGFTLNGNLVGENSNGIPTASWTFRKAPKFFDVVTYTGDGSGFNREVPHSLGSQPGFVVIKRTDSTSNWWVAARYSNGTYAIGNGTTDFALNSTNAASAVADATGAGGIFGSGTFKPAFIAQTTTANASGGTYVAYLFAHDTAADGIVQCGSFTTDGSGNATVTLGWEPQFVIAKKSSSTSNWIMLDVMRGFSHQTQDAYLYANTSGAEVVSAATVFGHPTATGFNTENFDGSATYIYLAIRRPNKPPTSGTEVFAQYAGVGGARDNTGFPVDLAFAKERSSGYGAVMMSRLAGGNYWLQTSNTNAEVFKSGAAKFDDSSGVLYGTGWSETNFSGSTYAHWNFRRAPGFFDVVCYTGDGVNGRAISHNLGAAPEFIILKTRLIPPSYSADFWYTYNANVGLTNSVALNSSNSSSTLGTILTTAPTSTTFTIRSSISVYPDAFSTNYSGGLYVAYLFASCPGVSKVGSYTGNGTSQTINCGFAAGARFILIKRTDSTGDWYVWDSARGIVAGNDPHLSLNTTTAEVTTDDSVDPDASGFIVNQLAATNINVSSATYIYLAIA